MARRHGPYSYHIENTTPRAEKNIAQLSPVDFRQAQRILEPIPAARCKPVQTLKTYHVLRLDLSDTLRATFRPWPDRSRLCLLHVGTHPQYDKFVRNYKGTMPETLVPIAESSLSLPAEPGPAEKEPAEHSGPILNGEFVAAGDTWFLANSFAEVLGKVMQRGQTSLEETVIASLDLLREEWRTLLAARDERLDDLESCNDKVSGRVRHTEDRLQSTESQLALFSDETAQQLLESQNQIAANKSLLREVQTVIAYCEEEQSKVADLMHKQECTSTELKVEVNQFDKKLETLREVAKQLFEKLDELQRVVDKNLLDWTRRLMRVEQLVEELQQPGPAAKWLSKWWGWIWPAIDRLRSPRSPHRMAHLSSRLASELGPRAKE